MPYPPRHYNICPCCGTEFDNDDAEYSYDELRYQWILRGAPWFYEEPPVGWNAAAQMAKFGWGLRTNVSAASTMNIRNVHVLELQLA
jgi:hypothetical protein